MLCKFATLTHAAWSPLLSLTGMQTKGTLLHQLFHVLERGSWWVHPKGADHMTMSGLGFRKALVGTGWAVLLCIIGFRKQSSHLVGSPFLALKFFAVWMGDCWPRALNIERTF